MSASRNRLRGFVVLALLLSAGCGGSQQEDAYLPWHEYNAEYFQEASALQLPDGYGWPPRAPGFAVNASDGKAITYETGCGATDADRYWFATWEEKWLKDQASRPTAAGRSLAQLLRLTETHLYRVSADVPTRQSYDGMLRRAQSGDPSGIERDVRLNAPRLYTMTAEASAIGH